MIICVTRASLEPCASENIILDLSPWKCCLINWFSFPGKLIEWKFANHLRIWFKRVNIFLGGGGGGRTVACICYGSA